MDDRYEGRRGERVGEGERERERGREREFRGRKDRLTVKSKGEKGIEIKKERRERREKNSEVRVT